jgi:outer membrane protein OmpA-like peptidoglycan-associated protein/Asp-tRNA(Asn)/Glu-tRNA(Gln) amidotransferase C subunit
MGMFFRLGLLIAISAGIFGCATVPKPHELDALERLRDKPEITAARKKAPELCKKGDKMFTTSTEKWMGNDIDDSVRAALLGTIFYRHALALSEQDKALARIGEAEDAIASTSEEQEKVQKELEDINEKIGLLKKLNEKQAQLMAEEASKNETTRKAEEERKALEAQMEAEKKAMAEKMAAAEKVGSAELALKTAETLSAPKYAPDLYKTAANILARAQADLAKGDLIAAQSSADLAKQNAEQAAAAAKPNYERDAQAADNRKKADALFVEASRLQGVAVRRDVKGSLQRVIISVPVSLLFVKSQTVIAPGLGGILDPIAELIRKKDYQTFPIQVIGHTDSRGRAASLLALSAARAQTVYNALITRGVEMTRLMSNGQGGSEPIADGRTAAGRASNHRIEIVFLYQ